jgi:hypothetical protein
VWREAGVVKVSMVRGESAQIGSLEGRKSHVRDNSLSEHRDTNAFLSRKVGVGFYIPWSGERKRDVIATCDCDARRKDR